MCHNRHVDVLSEEEGKTVDASNKRRPDDESIIAAGPFVIDTEDDARNDDAPPVRKHSRDQSSSEQHLLGDSRNERHEEEVAKVQGKEHLGTHALFSIHARRHSPVC